VLSFRGEELNYYSGECPLYNLNKQLRPRALVRPVRATTPQSSSKPSLQHAVVKLGETASSMLGLIRVASIRQVALNYPRLSILCLNGTEIRKCAILIWPTYFRKMMQGCITRRIRNFEIADGSKEDGLFKSYWPR
jgi:hypothetical protein